MKVLLGKTMQASEIPRKQSFLSCIIALSMCLTPTLVYAQPVPKSLTQDKNAKKKPLFDPAADAIAEPLVMDDVTKAAMARADKPGKLVSDRSQADKIYSIEIVGTRKVEPQAVLLQLKSHIDDPVDPKLVQEDIRRIFRMGIFSDVVVSQQVRSDKGVELKYELKEKPTLFQIKIEGNDAIGTEDIRKAIELERYHVADKARIQDSVDAVKKLYNEKGFFLATIGYRLQPTAMTDLDAPEPVSLKPDDEEKQPQVAVSTPKVIAPDFVDVVIEIDEGNKVRIQDIEFFGNANMPSDVLRAAVFSKQDHPLGFITNWGAYNKEMSEYDVMVIEQQYQDQGYLNIQVKEPQVALSADKSHVTMRISMDEGLQYRLGSLSITGDFMYDAPDAAPYDEEAEPHFERQNLLSRVRLAEGEIFNRTQVARDIMAIAGLYKDYGYAYVNIVPETVLNDETQTVDLNLKVEAGPRVRIESIEFKGNFKTADVVMRREMRLYEGDWYSESLSKISELRLNALGFFDAAKVNMTKGSTADTVAIEVEVTERKSGSLSVGGGYGTGGEGWMFTSQFSQNNLFGRGQTLTGTVQWSGLRRIFDLRFVDPYLFYFLDQPVTFSLALYNSRRAMGEYGRASTGGDLILGYPIGAPLSGWSRRMTRGASWEWLPFIPDFENLRLFLDYNVERVEINDVGVGVSLYGLRSFQPTYTTSLKPILQFDQRNDRMFPTAGYFLEAKAEFASPYLGSQPLVDLENTVISGWADEGINGGPWYLKGNAKPNNFFRYSLNTRFYYNFDKWIPLNGVAIRFNLDLGYLDTRQTDILTENYRIGGVGFGNPTGLRGYPLQSIGPVIQVGREREFERTREFVVGGNKQFLANFEFEVPVLAAMRMRAVAFMDFGNVYGMDENFFFSGLKNIDLRYRNYQDPWGTFYSLGLFASWGFGVRFMTPMGAMRVEFGFPIVKRPAGSPALPGGDEWQVEFNIGQSF